MTTNPNVYLDLMRASLREDDAESLAIFGESLMARGDPAMIWDLFEPVRLPLLRRLLDQARWLNSHAGGDRPESVANSIRAVDASMRTASDFGRSNEVAPTYPRAVTFSRPGGQRGARSAAAVLTRLGGSKSMYDRLHSLKGLPFSAHTRAGFEATIRDIQNPVHRIYAELLRERCPVSSRKKDIVRNHVDPEEDSRLWAEALRRANEAA